MSYVEESARELVDLFINHRNNAFRRMDKSSRGELVVLKFLAQSPPLAPPKQAPPSITPKMIAEMMNVSKPRIALILNALEKKGEILRKPSKTDRRQVLVSITEKGILRVNESKNEWRETLYKVFEEMGEEDTRKFIELIQQFMTSYKNHEK
ncbi:DNA-binding transcriptional regulator, MarR family [Pilibacter termitis]|uniref:DNA-binding transcriptional regulator, MarR family n=1 Tax=Pilibacter termitis TaxID=263852 RepID=A0A1T4NII3_9ENTE|nr:MarR family transcriptional regulator [Pilibacter termitis]SJZ79131.1 DNA-binding transcriptional regulator, MarR family [Pilibacter termitis]